MFHVSHYCVMAWAVIAFMSALGKQSGLLSVGFQMEHLRPKEKTSSVETCLSFSETTQSTH